MMIRSRLDNTPEPGAAMKIGLSRQDLGYTAGRVCGQVSGVMPQGDSRRCQKGAIPLATGQLLPRRHEPRTRHRCSTPGSHPSGRYIALAGPMLGFYEKMSIFEVLQKKKKKKHAREWPNILVNRIDRFQDLAGGRRQRTENQGAPGLRKMGGQQARK
jgi:hypothetical protein